MKFNQQSAINGANFGTSYIDESGNYEGKIVSCHKVVSGDYTKFRIQVENKNGQTTRSFLPISGPDGDMFGKDLIMSLMGILHISELNYVPDGENGERVPELCGKPIAFSLQKDIYTNKEGVEKFNMNLIRFFNPQTFCTYSETCEKKPPEIWKKPVADKVRKQKSVDTSFGYGANANVKVGSKEEKMPWEE